MFLLVRPAETSSSFYPKYLNTKAKTQARKSTDFKLKGLEDCVDLYEGHPALTKSCMWCCALVILAFVELREEDLGEPEACKTQS